MSDSSIQSGASRVASTSVKWQMPTATPIDIKNRQPIYGSSKVPDEEMNKSITEAYNKAIADLAKATGLWDGD